MIDNTEKIIIEAKLQEALKCIEKIDYMELSKELCIDISDYSLTITQAFSESTDEDVIRSLIEKTQLYQRTFKKNLNITGMEKFSEKLDNLIEYCEEALKS